MNCILRFCHTITFPDLDSLFWADLCEIISTLSLTVAVAFSDRQSARLASYHAPTVRTATRVSLPLVYVCGTVCHRTYDETLAADYLSDN